MKFGVCGFVKLGQRVVIKTTVNISQKRVGFTRTKKKKPSSYVSQFPTNTCDKFVNYGLFTFYYYKYTKKSLS